MASTVTNPEAAVSDSDPGLCPVPLAVEITKAIVMAGRRYDRYPLWDAITKGIEEAKEASRVTGDVWPWEAAEDVGYITWPTFQGALEDGIKAVVLEIPERQRLVHAAKKAYDELTAKGTGKPIKASKYGIKTCSRAGCGQRFAAKSHRHAYCSGACRTAAYEARQRADGDGRPDVSTEVA